MRPPEGQTASPESPITVLYERYALTILAYVRRHVASDQDAEDILLEVFLAALESDTFLHLQEPLHLAWLRRVAYHKYIDFHRHASRRAVVPLKEEMEFCCDDDHHAPEQVALRHEEHALLRERLALLPEPQQRVVLLRFGADMRCVDIARQLNQREGTVRAWLSRSLNSLRAIYAKQEEDKGV